VPQSGTFWLLGKTYLTQYQGPNPIGCHRLGERGANVKRSIIALLLGGLLLIGTPGAAFADRDRGGKHSHHESDDNDHSFGHRHFIFDRYFDWPEFYSYPFYGGYRGYYGGSYGRGYYGGPYYGDVPCGDGGYAFRGFYRFPFTPRCHYPGTPEPASTCGSAFSGCAYQGTGEQGGYGDARPDMGMAPGNGTVVIRDIAFNPAQITTKVGDVVVWSFDDNGQAHTVTADDNSFDSGMMTTGEFRHTFDKPGTYAYHCHVHPDRMMGTVIVTG
jgi:plastocyanin